MEMHGCVMRAKFDEEVGEKRNIQKAHSSHTRTAQALSNPTCETGFSPIGLGYTLQLVLFLDGIRVRGTLGGVDELVSEALGDGFNIAEC